jgi:pyochelin synthetase
MTDIEGRRSKLSPEKRALLEKRLRGIAADTGGAGSAPRPAEAPGVRSDELTADLLNARDAGAAGDAGNVGAGPARLVGDELWRDLVDLGEREARRLAQEPDLLADAAREPRLDQVSTGFVCIALASLGAFRQAGEERTIDGLIRDLGVLPKHRKVLRRWFATLAEDGILEPRGEVYVSREPLPPAALVELASAEQQAYIREKLPEVLTGKSHPLEFFLPEGSSSTVEASYRELAIFRYCNGISDVLLANQVQALPAGRRLRILEIGAGTGGTTASLLPLLPAERTTFVFTDVSKFFLDLGRKKFAEFPFVRYRELDIEKAPEPQGYPAASFDWIVAAHVLHATRNIAETLAHVRRLLAPGGVLLLLEETRFQRKFNFSMGFLPGFDHFEDYALRPLHPLLTAELWGEALRAHGFADFVSFSEAGSAPFVLGVDVMLARLGSA